MKIKIKKEQKNVTVSIRVNPSIYKKFKQKYKKLKLKQITVINRLMELYINDYK